MPGRMEPISTGNTQLTEKGLNLRGLSFGEFLNIPDESTPAGSTIDTPKSYDAPEAKPTEQKLAPKTNDTKQQ